jgi:hypothetical protein
VRTAYGLCAHFRQTDVVKLSLLDQFIEHLRIVFNLVIRIAPRRLEQIELLRPTQGLEDVVDAPAQILPAPVHRRFPGNQSALDGEEDAISVLRVLFEEASDELQVGNGEALSVELACGVV